VVVQGQSLAAAAPFQEQSIHQQVNVQRVVVVNSKLNSANSMKMQEGGGQLGQENNAVITRF